MIEHVNLLSLIVPVYKHAQFDAKKHGESTCTDSDCFSSTSRIQGEMIGWYDRRSLPGVVWQCSILNKCKENCYYNLNFKKM